MSAALLALFMEQLVRTLIITGFMALQRGLLLDTAFGRAFLSMSVLRHALRLGSFQRLTGSYPFKVELHYKVY